MNAQNALLAVASCSTHSRRNTRAAMSARDGTAGGGSTTACGRASALSSKRAKSAPPSACRAAAASAAPLRSGGAPCRRATSAAADCTATGSDAARRLRALRVCASLLPLLATFARASGRWTAAGRTHTSPRRRRHRSSTSDSMVAFHISRFSR